MRLQNLYTILKKRIKKIIFINSKYYKRFNNTEKKIILLDTPLHGNLGDHAICQAEKRIITNYYKEMCYFEFSHYDWIDFKNEILKGIKSNDLIFLPGGGFIGSLWRKEHEIVIDIISNLKDNRVIVFPQTIYFDVQDLELLEEFKCICNCCKDLTIGCRDLKSYNFMMNLFLDIKVKYLPDTAMCSKYCYKDPKRANRVLLCLRDDRERILDSKEIENLLITNGIDYDISSTVIKKVVRKYSREKEIVKKLKEFSEYSLIITDRLHAMVFCFLTKTPCIAFDNKSQKVSGVYEWIKDCNYVLVLNASDFSIDAVNKMKKIKVEKYNHEKLEREIENILG